MFLDSRLLSAPRVSTPLARAVLTFLVGLGVGTTIGPITMSRGGTPPVGSPPASRGPVVLHQAYPAEVLRVLDGDTFEARVHLWPGLETTTRVRLRGIDAPEMKARCADERVKAEAARDALRRILDQGEVGITRVTLDKYAGRVDADVSTASTPNVSNALHEAGHVRRYEHVRRRRGRNVG